MEMGDFKLELEVLRVGLVWFRKEKILNGFPIIQPKTLGNK